MIAINNHLATVELIFHQGLLLASEGRQRGEGNEALHCLGGAALPQQLPAPPHLISSPKLWLGIQGFRDAPETVKCCENQCVPAHFFQRDCSRGSRTGTSWAAQLSAAHGRLQLLARRILSPSMGTSPGAAGTGIALLLRTSALGAPSRLLLLLGKGQRTLWTLQQIPAHPSFLRSSGCCPREPEAAVGPRASPEQLSMESWAVLIVC